MFTFKHFLVGLLLTALGVTFLKYNFKLVGYTGRQDWIERYVGSGSTFFVYQVFAILLTICGLLYASGLGGPVGNFLVSPLRSLFSGFANNN